MASSTKRDLVIICNQEGNPYFEELRDCTGFDQDPRVKFVGTVYDQDLLKYIRKEAFAYIHGHEVGGTNPGLLEALDSLEDVSEWGQRAKANMKQNFTWEKIVGEYEELFLS